MIRIVIFILIFVSTISHAAWQQRGQDVDGEFADDYSGTSVAISEDSNIIIIGSPYNDYENNIPSPGNIGHARVYQYNGSAWVQVGVDLHGYSSEDFYGSSVSISGDGDVIAVGAPGNDINGDNSGFVRVAKIFRGTSFSNPGALINSPVQYIAKGNQILGEATGDLSGTSVAISKDGDIVAVGAPGNNSSTGHARVYQYDEVSSAWNQLGTDIDGEATGDLSGTSVAISKDGSKIVIGAEKNNDSGAFAGHARVYAFNSNTKLINDVSYTVAPGQTYSNADFSNADFSEVDLTGSSFNNCNLSNVNFNAANLVGVSFSYDSSLGEHNLSRGINFDNANLTGASFINAELDNDNIPNGEATFRNARLLNITLYNQFLESDPTRLNLPEWYEFLPTDGIMTGFILGPYIDLSGLDLTSVSNSVNHLNLRGLPLLAVNLSNSNLSGLHLNGVNWTGTSFQNSIFNYATISNSTFHTTDFSGANLDNADLSYADMTDIKFNNASMSNTYIWSTHLRNADFTGAELYGIQSGSCGFATFPPILPDGYIFKNGHIVGPNANLTGATFNNFSFVDQDFSGANLTDVNFKHAVLSNANFTAATFLGANLRGADLTDADLTDADLRQANLEGANLSGLDLSSFDLSGANITGTTLVNISPDQSNTLETGNATKNLTLSKIGNELQIYWDGADGEAYQLSYSTNGIDWQSYEPFNCEFTSYAVVGREIATPDEIEYRNTHWSETNEYAIMRMTAAHSMESMTNAPMIMFKVEAILSPEFN